MENDVLEVLVLGAIVGIGIGFLPILIGYFIQAFLHIFEDK